MRFGQHGQGAAFHGDPDRRADDGGDAVFQVEALLLGLLSADPVQHIPLDLWDPPGGQGLVEIGRQHQAQFGIGMDAEALLENGK